MDRIMIVDEPCHHTWMTTPQEHWEGDGELQICTDCGALRVVQSKPEDQL